MAGEAVGGEVGQDLADYAGEFVAVSGELGGNGYLGMLRVQGEHEMQIRGVGVHAARASRQRPAILGRAPSGSRG